MAKRCLSSSKSRRKLDLQNWVLRLLSSRQPKLKQKMEGARVIWSYVDRILNQPSLIRESSLGKYLCSDIFKRYASNLAWKTDKRYSNTGKIFGDVVLNCSFQKGILHIAGATANTKSHQTPFWNMLFYGSPSTGKTIDAKELAKNSELDYALMTGGDVAPLGHQAVTKIHHLFDWAKKSHTGPLLFIDKADAFLCKHNKTYMSEAQRSVLNALLFCTSDQSKDIVLVLTTNRFGDLDLAVVDQIDESLEFPLPGEKERLKFLKLYLNKYISQAGSRKSGWFKNLFKKQYQKIEIKGLTDDVIREAAAKIEGFSGREIAKLMAGVQVAVYRSEQCLLDTNLLREVVDYKLHSINRGGGWLGGTRPMPDLISGRGWLVYKLFMGINNTFLTQTYSWR